MSEQLIAPPFLFRFCIPCLSTKKAWSTEGVQLDTRFRLPSFQSALGAGPQFADLRLAWRNDGVLFHLQVRGKKQSPWCRESRLDDSDGLSLWIDTRDTQTIHRAGRFCHRFVFLPQGEGAKLERPVAELLNIQRAKENPKQPPRGALQVRSERRVDGYLMQGFIPATAMTGLPGNGSGERKPSELEVMPPHASLCRLGIVRQPSSGSNWVLMSCQPASASRSNQKYRSVARIPTVRATAHVTANSSRFCARTRDVAFTSRTATAAVSFSSRVGQAEERLLWKVAATLALYRAHS